MYRPRSYTFSPHSHSHCSFFEKDDVLIALLDAGVNRVSRKWKSTLVVVVMQQCSAAIAYTLVHCCC